MTDLVSRVHAALQQIPHDPRCFCSQGREAYDMGPCTCYPEREQRIAQRVAAAIDAAAGGAVSPYMISAEPLIGAALAALSGPAAPRDGENT